MVISGVVGSDATLDRYGDKMNPNGWKLENYLKNPVILAHHGYFDNPVGKALRVYVENEQLKFEIEFAPTDEGKEMFMLYQKGYMHAFSVGYRTTKWGVPSEDEYTHMEMELLELSCVSVPANPNAVTDIKSFAPHVGAIIDKCMDEPTQLTKKDVELIVAEKIDQHITKKEAEEVEQKADATLATLTSLRDALRPADKGIGKALKAINKIIDIRKEQNV